MTTTDCYLFAYKGKGAKVEIPRGLSTEGWGEAMDGFIRACGRKPTGTRYDPNYPKIVQIYKDQCHRGVYWHEELSGPGGISCWLFRTPDVSHEDVQACKNKLKSERDVVSLCVYRIREWINYSVPEQPTP